jgi:DNA recombination protein Rad52
MSFEPEQLRKLRAKLRPEHIRTRNANGHELSYVEGWHVVAEANRIFGYDGWERETIETKCVFTKQNGDRYSAAYVSRVRIIVAAGDKRIARDGAGAGEATTDSPGSAHELALKAAETDAMKRAFTTFGNQFGLSLYGTRTDRAEEAASDSRKSSMARHSGHSPDSPMTRVQANGDDGVPTGHIEKSELPIGVPKRIRDAAHLRRVASQPCMVCGKGRAHAHHLTFAQPRALGRKVSDEFTVPLCAEHHRELHLSGNERDWWDQRGLVPLAEARALWQRSSSPTATSSKEERQHLATASTYRAAAPEAIPDEPQ